MAKKNKVSLKNYFKTGATPTESQFGDLIDSTLNTTDDSYVKSVNGKSGEVSLSEPNTQGSMNYGILKVQHTGVSSTTDIFHIKLPYRTDTNNAMFYLHATGYNFQSNEIIDITWVGYCYKDGKKLHSSNTKILNSTRITAGVYEGSNKHIYVWFKVPNARSTTLRIDTMKVGNGTFLKEGDLELTVSTSVTL